MSTINGTAYAEEQSIWIDKRRRWAEERKRSIVEETFQPGATVSSVARKHQVPLASLFRWRRIFRNETGISVRGEGESSAAQKIEQLLDQVKHLQRLLGKLALENEILRETLPGRSENQGVAGFRS